MSLNCLHDLVLKRLSLPDVLKEFERTETHMRVHSGEGCGHRGFGQSKALLRVEDANDHTRTGHRLKSRSPTSLMAASRWRAPCGGVKLIMRMGETSQQTNSTL